jgi:predicted dehydrogenase
MLRQATLQGLPTIIDFNFHQIMSWQRAKTMLDAGAIGALRHVTVHWHIESRALQLRMRNWKTLGDDGGGVLGNFISHCFHYLEWFCGPIGGLSARIGGLPSESDVETTVAMALQFASGPLVSLSMSCASYLGAGHRIEFFGADGALVLHNPGADYMRGFELFHAKRSAAPLERIAVTIRTMRNIPTAASRRCRGWPRNFSTPSKAAARRRPDLPKAIACNG